MRGLTVTLPAQTPLEPAALIHESVDNFTDYLVLGFSSQSGHKYSSLCHRAANLSLLGSPCFTDVASLTPRSSILTLSFAPDAADEFMAALKRHGKFVGDKFGVQFQIQERQSETIGEMKSGKWIAYAARALVMRFWDLAKVSCSSHMNNKLLTHMQIFREPTPWTYCWCS